MRRFAGLFMAACMTVAVPAATVFADEVATESVEASAETDGETNAEEQDSNAESQEEAQETTDNTTQELNIAQSLDGVTLPADSEQITLYLSWKCMQRCLRQQQDFICCQLYRMIQALYGMYIMRRRIRLSHM